MSFLMADLVPIIGIPPRAMAHPQTVWHAESATYAGFARKDLQW